VNAVADRFSRVMNDGTAERLSSHAWCCREATVADFKSDYQATQIFESGFCAVYASPRAAQGRAAGVVIRESIRVTVRRLRRSDLACVVTACQQTVH
jgi:hypothetical protein